MIGQKRFCTVSNEMLATVSTGHEWASPRQTKYQPQFRPKPHSTNLALQNSGTEEPRQTKFRPDFDQNLNEPDVTPPRTEEPQVVVTRSRVRKIFLATTRKTPGHKKIRFVPRGHNPKKILTTKHPVGAKQFVAPVQGKRFSPKLDRL